MLHGDRMKTGVSCAVTEYRPMVLQIRRSVKTVPRLRQQGLSWGIIWAVAYSYLCPCCGCAISRREMTKFVGLWLAQLVGGWNMMLQNTSVCFRHFAPT